MQKSYNIMSCLNIVKAELIDVKEIREGIMLSMEDSYKQEDLPNIELPPNSFKKFSEAYVSLLELPTRVQVKEAV